MGETRNAYRILVGKSEGKRLLGRPRRRWVYNIKIDLREIGWDGIDWIDLAQDRDQWRALVNMAADVLTIVQLSDIHHDPTYLPGGNAVCGKPMCCRSSQGSPENRDASAGYWGDYRSCDTPWNIFEDTVQQIKRTHQRIDYIYMTGDIVDHAIWNTSIEKNSDVITKVLKQLQADFPDTPVFPILGNHEPSPLNVFAPHYITNKKVSTNWLYQISAEMWSVWLPSETRETILKGGFYTVLAQPGFRIIALNNNVCYHFNWWLIYNPRDQDDQLKWLAETLLQSEKAAEKVHILGHIPSGDTECLRTWSREFHKIIERFENTVIAIFNGHTHNDHFHVYYAIEEPTHPVSVSVNGGSVTPFSDLNSNYKIYTVDSATYNILDSETWIFNLTKANTNASVNPTWFKLYSFKDIYGVESLTPTEMDKLTHRLAANRSLLEEYSRCHWQRDLDRHQVFGVYYTDVGGLERRLRVFETRVLRGMFGPKRDEVTGGLRKLHNEELHKLYSSPSTIKMIKSKRMRLARYYVKNADTALANGCDSQCLKTKLCYTATAKMGDSTQCDRLMQEYEAANERGGDSGIINTVSGYLKPLING
ncbi:hypothetical protein B7P43_G04321 [Cryptotermes secundus]|uniref:Sphingomyelin phosphodiesterase n=1 Tax=Cryptotermes secundus TaxID=105785 RepID=A0A2J7PEZ4_9NEOP|nr:hypothetical protein B7P43_G04321 [Cryptotermes secundus]